MASEWPPQFRARSVPCCRLIRRTPAHTSEEAASLLRPQGHQIPYNTYMQTLSGCHLHCTRVSMLQLKHVPSNASAARPASVRGAASDFVAGTCISTRRCWEETLETITEDQSCFAWHSSCVEGLSSSACGLRHLRVLLLLCLHHFLAHKPWLCHG